MAKIRKKYRCQQCSYESSGWLGKCPECGSWNSFQEVIDQPASAATTKRTRSWIEVDTLGGEGAVDLSQVTGSQALRYPSGLGELDRVLGGGWVNGSLVLVGGDPGIGKSTLLLQSCGALLQTGKKVLYVTGEESPEQVKWRADRLQIATKGLALLAQTNTAKIEEEILRIKPDWVVVDSIQTMDDPEISSVPGTVSQVREGAARFLHLAKGLGTTVVLVGHVTKEGSLAGPRVLEHMVDTVLYFEGEKEQLFRILRCVKNRFGSTDEIGLFEMRSEGLAGISDPTTTLLNGRPIDVPGSVVTATMEGTRPVLVEIQALIASSSFQQPIRMSQGLDRMRLSVLLAVLQKKMKIDLTSSDCYVNVAGGLRIRETASDLAVVASIISSLKEKAIPEDLMMLGEVGLSGEIRGVPQIEKRIQEALRLGWKRFVVPSQSEKTLSRIPLPPQAEIFYVSLLSEALDLLFPAP